jgi:hypothetical protein
MPLVWQLGHDGGGKTNRKVKAINDLFYSPIVQKWYERNFAAQNLCIQGVTGRFPFHSRLSVSRALPKQLHQLCAVHQTPAPRKSLPQRSPTLSSWDRILAGLMALLVRPTRLLRSEIVLKPSTLLALHKAMSRRKYRMLFSPNRHGLTLRPGARSLTSNALLS